MSYHPALGYKCYNLRGSEMFKENYRRMLTKPDSAKTSPIETKELQENPLKIEDENEAVEIKLNANNLNITV